MNKPQSPPPQPPPDPKPRTTSTGVLAGRLFERIKAMRSDCEHEIRRSPDDIRAKWAAREKQALEGVDPFVRQLAIGMLDALKAKAADATPEK